MRRTMACALLTLSLLLTACEMRAEVSVNEDGSGTFGFVFGLEPIFMRAFGPGEDSPLTMFREELESSGAPWKVTEFSEPGLQGVRATLPFQNVDHLREQLEDLSDADTAGLFGSGDTLDDGIVIEKIDEGWSFRARGVTPAARSAEKTGVKSGDMFEGLAMEEELDQAFRFEFHVTLPGGAVSHNATEVDRVGDKTRFVWRTGMYDEEALELRAATEPIKPGPPIVPGALVVVVVGGAIMFLRRGERPGSVGGAPPVVLEGLPVVVGSALADPSGTSHTADGSGVGHGEGAAPEAGTVAEDGADEPVESAEYDYTADLP